MRNCVTLAVTLAAVVVCACDAPEITPETRSTVPELTLLDADSLFEAVDAFVASSGHIWVLSKYQPYVHLFDSAGTYLRGFGRYGRGPNELLVPRNFVGEASGSQVVEIWDAGRRQVVRFTPGGEMVDYIDLPVGTGHILGELASSSFGDLGRALRVADGYVLDTYEKHVRVGNDMWAGRLTFTGPNGQTRGSASLSDPPRARPDSPIFEVFQPIPLWTVCANGSVAVVDAERHAVRWIDAEGATIRRDTLRLEDNQITKSDIERYVALRAAGVAGGNRRQVDTSSPAARAQIAQTVADLAKELPKRAPPVRARCDPDNQVWVQQFSTESDARGYGPRWRRLDNRSADVLINFRPGFAPLHFGRRIIVGVHTDSLHSAKAGYMHYASRK
jgi:hypothetical protein